MAADKAKQKANPTLKPPNPNPTKPQLASWADRVKVTDSNTRFTLDPITKTDDGEFLDITADMLTDDAEQWNRCMVGFFPGFRMNYNTVNVVAHRVWKAGGLESQANETTNGVSPPHQCPDKEAKDQPRVHLHVQEAGPASHHREQNIDAIPATQTKGSTTAPLSAKEPSISMAKGDKGVDNLQLKTFQQEVDAARTKKGKMKETIQTPCTAIESDSSHSQQFQDEEGSSETNANYGCDTGSRDMSPTTFTKVKKKKGGKGKKEAHRL
ncbi:hypothetical protein OIU79_024861 [Salix purpurea]|uniref:Uncharacterized protein n=1 Tax=Salix purpurea TaxID=77065 RepID=A0A9Q1A6P3_SALPP|nr:hypothetical protein OIU79_024861 [Salix purpurea]